MGESNPRPRFGKPILYHLTNPALFKLFSQKNPYLFITTPPFNPSRKVRIDISVSLSFISRYPPSAYFCSYSSHMDELPTGQANPALLYIVHSPYRHCEGEATKPKTVAIHLNTLDSRLRGNDKKVPTAPSICTLNYHKFQHAATLPRGLALFLKNIKSVKNYSLKSSVSSQT